MFTTNNRWRLAAGRGWGRMGLIPGLAGFLVLAGCAQPHYQTPDTTYRWSATPAKKLEGTHEQKVAELAEQIAGLADPVDPGEARRMADAAIRKAEELREQYDVVGSALVHNVMVNVGVRDRGLCYQWADDMYPRLALLRSKTLELHRATALTGRMREHNTVVVTAVGQSFYEGLVLDAWKYGGRLAWVRVPEAKYVWRPFDEAVPEMIAAWEKSAKESEQRALQRKKMGHGPARKRW